MRFWRIALYLFLAIALFLLVPSSILSQDESLDSAKVRIGYFAVDPRTVDTYIDANLASFSDGWEHVNWNTPFVYPVITLMTATPYMNVPAGVHSITLVPKGDSLDTAILGPEEITLDASHVYALAIVGQDDDLNITVSDESVAFADADPAVDFLLVEVHNLRGAPPLSTLFNSQVMSENFDFGDIATTTATARSFLYKVTAAEDPSEVIHTFGATMAPGISDFHALIGEYPGTPGVDHFIAINWAYPGEITIIDGEPVAIGTEISGEIEHVAERVRHTLTIDDDMILNISVKAAGRRYPGSWDAGLFASEFFVYDADGNLLFWTETGLEGITLVRGSYIVEVGGEDDIVAGPYTLIIEEASD